MMNRHESAAWQHESIYELIDTIKICDTMLDYLRDFLGLSQYDDLLLNEIDWWICHRDAMVNELRKRTELN